jgi:4'-phosphopantetheinyl transferase
MIVKWSTPKLFPKLQAEELHVWKAQYRGGIKFQEDILTKDERLRLRGFHFENDRRMFLFAHGQLRHILGNYLGLTPKQVRFCYTQFGKPYIPFMDDNRKIEFNLSHSGDIVLIAVTNNIPVGVDVEEIRPITDVDLVASRYFSLGEQLDLHSLSGPEKLEAFYKCWTRKESLIKAYGVGLSMPLDSFQVSLLPGEPVRLLRSPDQQSWTLLDINLVPGYAGAVAAPLEGLQACYFSSEEIITPQV